MVKIPDTAAITVVVVDDHELVAEALERVLAAHPRITLVGRATTMGQAYDLVAATRPTIVVMDHRLPDGSGVDCTRFIKRDFKEVDVVMLTGFADGATLALALEAGCSGFVAKEGRFDELVATIEAVARGQVRVPQHLLEDLVVHLRPRTQDIGHDLTAREREVLALLAEGCSTAELVDKLVLSIHTVRNHVRNILTKLHSSSRLEAVAVATRAGLIEPPAA